MSLESNEKLREKVAFLESMLSVKKDIEHKADPKDESDVELDDWSDVTKRMLSRRTQPSTPTPSLRSGAESKANSLGLLKK